MALCFKSLCNNWQWVLKFFDFIVFLFFALQSFFFFFPSFISSITKDEGSHLIMIIGLVLVHINKH